MKKAAALFRIIGFILLISCFSFPVVAGYKSKPWTLRDREGYPTRYASEGVTIAVEPLYRDAMAEQVFGTDDMVTRGIMPLAIIIFNDNDFPVEVDGLSIEIIQGKNRIKTLSSKEAAYCATKREKSPLFSQPPVLRFPKAEQNKVAIADFENKFLGSKIVGPHAKGGGFLYMSTRDSIDITTLLARSALYIPNVYRLDNRSKMMFFEIELSFELQKK
jgi:hypothetical protein